MVSNRWQSEGNRAFVATAGNRPQDDLKGNHGHPHNQSLRQHQAPHNWRADRAFPAGLLGQKSLLLVEPVAKWFVWIYPKGMVLNEFISKSLLDIIGALKEVEKKLPGAVITNFTKTPEFVKMGITEIQAV